MWEDSKQQETSVEGRRRTKQRPRSTLAAPVARPAGAQTLSRPLSSRTSLRPSEASSFLTGSIASRSSAVRSSVRPSMDVTITPTGLSLPPVSVNSTAELEQQENPSAQSSDDADNTAVVFEEEENSFLEDELVEARAHVDQVEHDLVHLHTELEQAKQEAVSAKVASRVSQARGRQLQVEVEEAHLVLNSEARTVEKLQRDLQELQEVLVQERRRKAGNEQHGLVNYVDIDAFQTGGDSLAAQLQDVEEEPGPEPVEAFEEELQEMARMKSMQRVEAIEAERVAIHKVWTKKLQEVEVESERVLQRRQEDEEHIQFLQVRVNMLTTARVEEVYRMTLAQHLVPWFEKNRKWSNRNMG